MKKKKIENRGTGGLDLHFDPIRVDRHGTRTGANKGWTPGFYPILSNPFS
jgi:hypothetical protein